MLLFLRITLHDHVNENDQLVSGYKSYQQFDLKGHVGVTGVKKVNHVKNMKTAVI